jgi:hypothetical protein
MVAVVPVIPAAEPNPIAPDDPNTKSIVAKDGAT